MPNSLTPARIASCYDIARRALLAERGTHGHWEGALSTSALSTATAVMALEMVRRDGPDEKIPADRTEVERGEPTTVSSAGPRGSTKHAVSLSRLIDGGLAWLVDHQNDDGGWGDTTKSLSNISTTMLAHAVFHATTTTQKYRTTVDAAAAQIDRAGGVGAVRRRYGKDKTFSIPILTHCALAGLVDWSEVTALPFELACLPPRFYKTVGLPVVSYALPALIAIGQVRHAHRKPFNPVFRLIRRLAIRPSLKMLAHIQPENGGFLEAAPLTSFVTMSLAGMGLSQHPVARKGVRFLVNSVRDDGSWPIDTNLATWVTTLSVGALKEDLPRPDRSTIRDWLLGQQYRTVHPYTNANPGGWAWTDLPGGVPDADDTPGAVLSLLNLCEAVSADDVPAAEQQALSAGVKWLLDLQNRDGGWPTFCRGWGTLPFDRSAPDLTAHSIRALLVWMKHPASQNIEMHRKMMSQRAVRKGFKYLATTQRADGSWLPLWFGNQYGQDDENPTYGTARVLAAYREAGRFDDQHAQRGLRRLRDSQNEDGGWGGVAGIASSVEETALAVEILDSSDPESVSTRRGLAWLLDRVEKGTFTETTPIGFYFAKLWYFEKLYPLTFMVSALGRAYRSRGRFVPTPQHYPNKLQQTVSD